MKIFRVYFIDRFGSVQVHNVSGTSRERVAALYANEKSVVIKQRRS